VASLLHLAPLPQNSSGRTWTHDFLVADHQLWYGMKCHHSCFLGDACLRSSVFCCCQKTSRQHGAQQAQFRHDCFAWICSALECSVCCSHCWTLICKSHVCRN
jgi:hypothetical protein